MSQKIQSSAQLERIKQQYLDKQAAYAYQIYICSGAGCISSNCGAVMEAVVDEVNQLGLDQKVAVYQTGCIGTCAVGPVMLILPERVFYTELTSSVARNIIKAHLTEGRILEEHTFYDVSLDKRVPVIDDIEFFKPQVKIAMRNCGYMEYGTIEAYISRDGYRAANKVIGGGMTPEQVINEVKTSGLRGRGGAGFPTGVKWAAGYKSSSDQKYIVCNADEGDPGAFMDRSLIEGDPHNLIEGMMIGGYAIGASVGFVYVRAEYPTAVERLDVAIKQAREHGLLGDALFGSDFSFDIEIRIGAGAFVCGEETALMNSIEGRRGEPNQKPPFPFQAGLFGKPTIINNVETLYNIPAILLNGGDWYAGYGAENSKGTKVFALAGDVVNTGIIEVPIGIPLGRILYDIGGGISGGTDFKAAQIGGPSGGCITRENINVPTDYDSLTNLGAIMGSGGLIAMNQDTCMVDTARFFMDFICDESCGKCTACRVGTKRMLEILDKITSGNGTVADIGLLEDLGNAIKDTAMCGLGQTAPNPVLSTIANFREEYLTHVVDKRCPAGICASLVSYEIIQEKCKRCSLCKTVCPVDAISGVVKGEHRIDKSKCIKCGACVEKCKFDAIVKR